jgi:hypothetical protein
MRAFLFVLKIFLLCTATFFSASVEGQSTTDLALKNLQRQKWQRAYELLTKSLAKDSLNVTAKYVLAQYFFSEENPAFHLDSAYHHVLQALNDFEKTKVKQRERLRRFPVDSAKLVHLRSQIDSVAFAYANGIQTEIAWIYFIDNFSFSSALPRAKELRDSIAYADAVQEKTYKSFEKFFQKYPEARQASDAHQHYERLLFTEKTSDQKLKSFERFLAEYPQSPYRFIAEQTIFEYQTASGEYQKFVDFIRSYPQNSFVRKAKNILFHLIRENERLQKWPAEFSTDSLKSVIELKKDYLVPFVSNKKLGLMDSEGNEIIPAQADSLDQVYSCGNIDEDVISLPDKIIAKNGSVIWPRGITNIDELGSGFLLIEEGECLHLIHKTGFTIGESCIDDAKILNGKLIAIQKNRQWSILTLSGRPLIQNLEDVFCVRDVIGIKRNAKIKLHTIAGLTNLPPSPESRGISEFDEMNSWNNDLVYVRKGNKTGLIDQSLNTFIEPGHHNFNPSSFGVIVTDSSGVRLYNYSGQKSKIFQHALAQNPWVAVKDSLWSVLEGKTLNSLGSHCDTVYFSGRFAVAYKKDSCKIFFSPQHFWNGRHVTGLEFIPGKDSSAFLMIEQREKKTLYNEKGEKLFTTSFDKIQYAGHNLFIVHKKEKKGLMNHQGKLLLPVEYDAIGTINNGIVSLLKSMKFGLFDCVRKKLIPTYYAKNLIPYNSSIMTAYKNGLYGFLGWDNKSFSKFEFNDIQFWNDTTALVKRNSQWMLYEIKTRKVLLDQIKDLQMIRSTPTEKLAIIYQGANHGVIHNQKGTIIPISYTDVINVGSPEKPLYFTEKFVKEASIFVVIHYNDQGKMVRKEIYDQEDYDKIYCVQN